MDRKSWSFPYCFCNPVFASHPDFFRDMIRAMRTLEPADQSAAGTQPEQALQALEWALGASPSAALAASADGRIFFLNAAARTRWPSLAQGALVSRGRTRAERGRRQLIWFNCLRPLFTARIARGRRCHGTCSIGCMRKG
jgi:hypothetical protein